MSDSSIILVRAAAVRDAAGTNLRPGGLLIQHQRILAVGHPDALAQRNPHARNINLPDQLILPAFVNAHAHLDLTGMGTLPYTGRFTGWASQVMAYRATQTTRDIHAAVLQGLQASHRAGVGWIGDIAGSPAALDAFRNAPAPARGVAFLELFGIGSSEPRAIQNLDALSLNPRESETQNPTSHIPPALGLQPHAPYSAGVALFLAAARLSQQHGLPLATHLAETLDELQFLRDGTGLYADLFKQLGRWDGSIKPSGLHPVDHLREPLLAARWLVAHCNYVEDSHIRQLAESHASVAYCPIASEYFGHVNHRYRDMLAAGVNVCLGTDSILCQPHDEPQPLGILPAMRRLYRRDHTPPETLLRMATINGLTALRLPPSLATFTSGLPGSANTLIATTINPADPVDPLIQMLTGNAPATPVALDVM